MTTQPDRPGQPPGAAGCAPNIVRLWNEPRRAEQVARLKDMQVQACDEAGKNAWEQAAHIHGQLPDGVRVDLPSPRVFARVLGVYRSAIMVKKRPMAELELSAKEIATAAGYGKTVVEAALRWLGSEPILYRGHQVARGLGYINRVRRKAKAFVQGVLQNVYRTSQTCLTFLGRGLLNLIVPEEDREAPGPPWHRKRRAASENTEEQTMAPATEPNWELGLARLQALKLQI